MTPSGFRCGSRPFDRTGSPFPPCNPTPVFASAARQLPQKPPLDMCRHDNLGCIKQTTSVMAVDVRCRLGCDDMLLQALMEGIALADFQTIQDRGRGAVLVTTLAHSSDQWIASEVRIASPDAGPQVFGSSLTYMRGYCALGILGLAPDTDDDGKAAQERADQQARQRPPQRVEQQRSTPPPSRASEGTQRLSSESGEPVLTPICGSASKLRL